MSDHQEIFAAEPRQRVFEGQDLSAEMSKAMMVLIAEELSSRMRHDLRNQMTIISGALYYLRRKLASTELWAADPRMKEFVGLIDQQISLATARLDPDRMADPVFNRRAVPTELSACVRAALDNMQRTPGARICVGPTPGRVNADLVEVALALRCVLENAVEAMPLPGVVQVRGGAIAHGATAVIEISAPGGFGAVTPDQALEPFFTTKPGHLGVGLNIASRICKRYGGKLTIHAWPSAPIVELTFPVTRDLEGRS